MISGSSSHLPGQASPTKSLLFHPFPTEFIGGIDFFPSTEKALTCAAALPQQTTRLLQQSPEAGTVPQGGQQDVRHSGGVRSRLRDYILISWES